MTNDNPEGLTRTFPYFTYGQPMTDADRGAFNTAMQKLSGVAKAVYSDVDEDQALKALIRETMIDALLLKELRRRLEFRVVLVHEGKLVPLTTKTYEYSEENVPELRKQILEKWPGATILNELPEQEALPVYKAAKRAMKAASSQTASG